MAGGKYNPSYRNPCWSVADGGALRCIPYVYIMGAFHSGVTSMKVKVASHPSFLTVRLVSVTVRLVSVAPSEGAL